MFMTLWAVDLYNLVINMRLNQLVIMPLKNWSLIELDSSEEIKSFS